MPTTVPRLAVAAAGRQVITTFGACVLVFTRVMLTLERGQRLLADSSPELPCMPSWWKPSRRLGADDGAFSRTRVELIPLQCAPSVRSLL